jgi:hypothetical protein
MWFLHNISLILDFIQSDILFATCDSLLPIHSEGYKLQGPGELIRETEETELAEEPAEEPAQRIDRHMLR